MKENHRECIRNGQKEPAVLVCGGVEISVRTEVHTWPGTTALENSLFSWTSSLGVVSNLSAMLFRVSRDSTWTTRQENTQITLLLLFRLPQQAAQKPRKTRQRKRTQRMEASKAERRLYVTSSCRLLTATIWGSTLTLCCCVSTTYSLTHPLFRFKNILLPHSTHTHTTHSICCEHLYYNNQFKSMCLEEVLVRSSRSKQTPVSFGS